MTQAAQRSDGHAESRLQVPRFLGPSAPTQPVLTVCRDPNTGLSSVPTRWYPYTMENGNYLEINKNLNSNSMKQHLRTQFLRFWALTYQALPTVAEGAILVPPVYDPEAVPVPPADDSEVVPEAPADDSLAPQMPAAIGF